VWFCVEGGRVDDVLDTFVNEAFTTALCHAVSCRLAPESKEQVHEVLHFVVMV